ncbi:hypothetical protein ZWY2020_057047 [Hordeum vulgare]|nr:hypothetical protein ZWY2020_057047 [Hordeum vulgare]
MILVSGPRVVVSGLRWADCRAATTLAQEVTRRSANWKFIYSVSLVSADKIPSDQYSLEFLGLKVKETSKIDQCRRPEKPIEIYEFEG